MKFAIGGLLLAGLLAFQPSDNASGDKSSENLTPARPTTNKEARQLAYGTPGLTA